MASMNHSFIFLGSLIYVVFLMYTRKRVVLVSCFMLLVGFFYFHYYDKNNKSDLDPKTEKIFGEIVSLPKVDGDSLSFFFQKENGERFLVSYRLRSEQEVKKATDLTIHHDCIVKGIFEKPQGRTNPHAFDYRKYLYEQKVHWILKSTDVSCQSKKTPTFIKKVRIFRQQQIYSLEKRIDGESKAVLQALVFGYQNGFAPDLHQAYRELGVIHLLVISGSHVSIFTASLFFLLIRLGVTRERAFESLMILLPLYAFLTGESPSVIRACVMAFLICFSLRYQMFLKPIDAISIAALIMLLWNPYLLFHVGFQLTFMISLCLILSATYVLSLRTYKAQLLITSLISELASIPILIYHFYEISYISIFVNLFYIPLMTLIIFPLAYLVYFIPFLFFLSPLLEIILVICHRFFLWMTQQNALTIVFGKPSLFWVFLMYSAIFFFFVVMEKKGEVKTWIRPFLLCFLLLLFQAVYPYFLPIGRVTMIDVGQGESILIELPYRKGVYLIDTGGVVSFGKEKWQEKKQPFDPGKDIVVPLLKAKGIATVDWLILSHGDSDHIGGTKAIFDELHVKEVWFPFGPLISSTEKEIIELIKQKEISLYRAKKGDIKKDNYSEWHVLNPVEKEGLKDNDRSIVLWTELGGMSFLFTGDLEEEMEKEVMKNYPSLQVDVLKAGHHGSKTSTSPAFLDHLKPMYVYISAGRNNRYGHPHEEVIQEIFNRNISVFRTDEQGAVTYTFFESKKGYFTVESQKND